MKTSNIYAFQVMSDDIYFLFILVGKKKKKGTRHELNKVGNFFSFFFFGFLVPFLTVKLKFLVPWSLDFHL